MNNLPTAICSALIWNPCRGLERFSWDNSFHRASDIESSKLHNRRYRTERLLTIETGENHRHMSKCFVTWSHQQHSRGESEIARSGRMWCKIDEKWKMCNPRLAHTPHRDTRNIFMNFSTTENFAIAESLSIFYSVCRERKITQR